MRFLLRLASFSTFLLLTPLAHANPLVDAETAASTNDIATLRALLERLPTPFLFQLILRTVNVAALAPTLDFLTTTYMARPDHHNLATLNGLLEPAVLDGNVGLLRWLITQGATAFDGAIMTATRLNNAVVMNILAPRVSAGAREQAATYAAQRGLTASLYALIRAGANYFGEYYATAASQGNIQLMHNIETYVRELGLVDVIPTIRQVGLEQAAFSGRRETIAWIAARAARGELDYNFALLHAIDGNQSQAIGDLQVLGASLGAYFNTEWQPLVRATQHRFIPLVMSFLAQGAMLPTHGAYRTRIINLVFELGSDADRNALRIAIGRQHAPARAAEPAGRRPAWVVGMGSGV